MHYISVRTGSEETWGILDGGSVRLSAAEPGVSLGELLQNGSLDTQSISDELGEPTPLSSVTLAPPVTDATKVICVGLNYADHIEEMNRPWPEKPVIFTRWADTFVGSGEDIIKSSLSEQYDYEGEFCIVIGKSGRHISEENALDHVFGYTIMNDGSFRDYQRHTHQFAPGKNFPRSGSLGPSIITKEAFGEVASQKIITRFNGEIVQNSSLDQLVFSVEALVAYCSEWTELRPGDIIATGTPGGVGDGHDPKKWMKPGDVLEVEVEGIGTLSNTVRAE